MDTIQFKSYANRNSTKLHLDKYFTPTDLAQYCIDKTYEIIGKDNVTDVIEPAAGNGAFSNLMPGCTAYDLEPEHPSIIAQDYLALDVEYKPGRLVIGNPPYGSHNSLSVKFYKKSTTIADYISFILPISQLNNDCSMYEFDLVYSENLGKRKYSGREVHCCLNIYKRPPVLNKKPKYNLKDVEIVHVDNGENCSNKKVPNADLIICGWGHAIGKVVEKETDFAKTYCFIIKNEEYRQQVIDVITNADWCKLHPMTASPSLAKWQIVKHLKEQIPGLE